MTDSPTFTIMEFVYDVVPEPGLFFAGIITVIFGVIILRFGGSSKELFANAVTVFGLTITVVAIFHPIYSDSELDTIVNKIGMVRASSEPSSCSNEIKFFADNRESKIYFLELKECLDDAIERIEQQKRKGRIDNLFNPPESADETATGSTGQVVNRQAYRSMSNALFIGFVSALEPDARNKCSVEIELFKNNPSSEVHFRRLEKCLIEP